MKQIKNSKFKKMCSRSIEVQKQFETSFFFAAKQKQFLSAVTDNAKKSFAEYKAQTKLFWSF